MNRRMLTGVILAGGRGARMGGVDKGLIAFEGRPLIEHVIARLRPQVTSVLISANRNIDVYARYGVPVIQDSGAPSTERFDGPLAGILAALNTATTDYVIVVPCDAPRLPRDLVSRFIAAHERSPHLAYYAHDGQRPQFVFALLATSLRQSLQGALARGDRKVELWFDAIDAVPVDCADIAGAFVNINSSADFAMPPSTTSS